jgi:arginase family enzyme
VDLIEGPKEWLYDSNNQTATARSSNVFFINQVSLFNKKLHELTWQASRHGDFVLTLGGDHSIAIGTIAGLRLTYPDLAVLWIDAHAVIPPILYRDMCMCLWLLV